MPRTEVPLIPVFTRWIGARPLRVLDGGVGITARVIQAGVGALPFADASLDLVIAAQVVENLTELIAALGLIRRVLRPRGLFRRTNLTATEHHASAGIAGKE